jgi:hypothetical protein
MTKPQIPIEKLEDFFGDYLTKNEPDKILCRAVTFCQKVNPGLYFLITIFSWNHRTSYLLP